MQKKVPAQVLLFSGCQITWRRQRINGAFFSIKKTEQQE
jgi:hypothetical protein